MWLVQVQYFLAGLTVEFATTTSRFAGFECYEAVCRQQLLQLLPSKVLGPLAEPVRQLISSAHALAVMILENTNADTTLAPDFQLPKATAISLFSALPSPSRPARIWRNL